MELSIVFILCFDVVECTEIENFNEKRNIVFH